MRSYLYCSLCSCLFALAGAYLLGAAVMAAPAAANLTGTRSDPAGVAAGVEFFERHVRPVLADHCYQCHSTTATKIKGGLLLDTRDGLLKGGDNGPVLTPGDPDHSRLIEAVRYANPDLQMPPKGKGDRLSPRQVEDLVTWVKMGAPDPREAATTARAPGAASDVAAARRFWSFQPVRDVPAPTVKDAKWPRTDVDRFILATLEQKGLKPAPAADKRTLIRRATFDLTGLPPTADEVEAFEKDPGPDAFDKVIDRLLASPRYGERWGRYWLDLTRYSDTKGYVYDREERRFYHAHTYRDWVIRAFNEDLPYDQFLLWQIAGDQLPPRELRDGRAEGGGFNPDLAALGFLTVGRRFLEVPHDIIDDRIDVVCRTTMGLTVACARCHDHKFDPIPTQDYYSLYGVFAGSYEKSVRLDDGPAPAAPESPERQAYEKGLADRTKKLNDALAKRLDEAYAIARKQTGRYLAAVPDADKLPDELFYQNQAKDDLKPVFIRQWTGYLLRAGRRFDPVFAPWTALSALPAATFARQAPQALAKLSDDPEHRLNPAVAAAFAAAPPDSLRSMKDVAADYANLFADVEREWAETSKKPGAATLADPNREALRQVLYGPGSPVAVPPGSISDVEWFFDENTRVELQKLQAEVDRWNLRPGAPDYALILVDRPEQHDPHVFKRGNPSARGEEVPRRFLAVLTGKDRQPFRSGSGRLELARSIANKDNPLTARVMVNRIWQHHFGSGLVRTPSDFGTRCDGPTHPELLDWLAARFVEGNWSVKQLHRLILRSAVYQQAAVEDEATSAAKAAADPDDRLLSRFPRQRLDFEAARDALLAASGELDLQHTGGPPVDLLPPAFNPRRTVYGTVDRQYVPPVLRAFDFANPDLHVPQRSETTVPQQALFFMNSPFLTGRAKALARRPEVASAADSADRVRRLYRVVFQRPPTEREVDLGLRYIQSCLAPAAPAPPSARRAPATAWRYGFGSLNASGEKLAHFDPLPFFTGEAWQGGPSWPDAKLGWVRLTADGGHAGNDLQHAAVRRWVAPRDATVTITGVVRHEYEPGDGICAHILCSRGGRLATYTLHNQWAEMKLGPVTVQAGDTIDFVVDFRDNLNSDMFTWAPVITADAAPAGQPTSWDAKKEFGGTPTTVNVSPPDPWERYAQVLLSSNEFVFVD